MNFPLDGLDVTPYMAPAAVELGERRGRQGNGSDKSSERGGEQEGSASDEADEAERVEDLVIPEEMEEMEEQLRRNGVLGGSAPVFDGGDVDRTCYDLYSTVHHVGALGGGHYLAAVREDNGLMQRVVAPPSPTEGTPSPGTASPLGQKWWCYNDSVVVPVTKASEIVSPSAYVLFYVRRDVRALPVRSIHHSCAPPVTGGAIDAAEGTTLNSDVHNLGVETHNMDIRDNMIDALSPVSSDLQHDNRQMSISSDSSNRSVDQCVMS